MISGKKLLLFPASKEETQALKIHVISSEVTKDLGIQFLSQASRSSIHFPEMRDATVCFSLEWGVGLLSPDFLDIISLLFLVKLLLVAVNRTFKKKKKQTCKGKTMPHGRYKKQHF